LGGAVVGVGDGGGGGGAAVVVSLGIGDGEASVGIGDGEASVGDGEAESEGDGRSDGDADGEAESDGDGAGDEGCGRWWCCRQCRSCELCPFSVADALSDRVGRYNPSPRPTAATASTINARCFFSAGIAEEWRARCIGQGPPGGG
jgi:hypothetical protein